MSSVYATEPSTSGRVLFETTHGPLELQLWCRECPLTTRLFLQLCVDGYYDNMIFHRVIPDFLIQTGLVRQGTPPSSQTHNLDATTYRKAIQADEAMERRQYEVHSRLKFNHRGQVAMALGVSDDPDAEIQPQFFITLDEAPYLDGKHVLFGTCIGPTMFNALRIGRTEVDESDVQHAPRVMAVKIVDNPIFTDLQPQAHPPWKVAKEDPVKKTKKKRKGKKDFNVLSFGNEMEDESVGTGIKSSHDVVPSEVLSNRVDDQVKEAVTKQTESSSMRSNRDVASNDSADDTEPVAVRVEKSENAIANEGRASVIKDSSVSRTTTSNGDHAVETSKSFVEPGVKETLRGASALKARLAKYKKKSSTDKRQREEDTMSKLLAFRGKVRNEVCSKKLKDDDGRPKDDDLAAQMVRRLQSKDEPSENGKEAPTYHGQLLDDSGGEEDKGSWLSTKFKCRKHTDQLSGNGDQLAADGRTMDDYSVVDEKKEHSHRPREHHKHTSSRSHQHDKRERRGHRDNRGI